MQPDEKEELTSASPDALSTQPSISSPADRYPVLFNERGLRAGWRLLLWLAFCFVFLTITQLLYRAVRQHLPKDFVSDFVRLLLVASVLGATAVMAKLEKRPSSSYGLSDRKGVPHFWFGVLIGWLALTLMLWGLRLAQHFYFGAQYMHGSAALTAGLLNAFSFLFEVALFEEILFRGYALYTLADGMGFWPASILLSVLFAAAHLTNSGEAKAGIIAVVFFGLMLCLSVWRTGSLFWAIGFHFMWDYSETFLYGVPDSGFVSPQHLLSAKFMGPAWITGGSVGPEGSWFIFLVLGGIALVIHFAYPNRTFVLPARG